MPVSRAENKLAGAMQAFSCAGIFKDKVVLDIGSSTGGFTEYALEAGARKVIAVEKGTRQMKAPLRFDARVELHEKTDVFDMKLSEEVEGSDSSLARARRYGARFAKTLPLSLDAVRISTSSDAKNARQKSLDAAKTSTPVVSIPTPDIILADVSFVSLTKVLMYARMELARSDTDYFVMLKPQFEARPEQLNKGVVKNEKVRREIIRNFENWLKKQGFLVVKKRDNELSGRHGNVERFYWLKTV